MLKDGISVPGLTLRYLFKTLPKHVYFSLIRRQDADLHDKIRSQIVGGPSIVFHRYHAKDETKLRGETGKLVKKILGFDANALSLWEISQFMCVETPVRYRMGNDGMFQRTYLE